MIRLLGRAMEGDGAALARASLPTINAQLIARGTHAHLARWAARPSVVSQPDLCARGSTPDMA